MSQLVVHAPTLRASLGLFLVFVFVAIVLGMNLPAEYPMHLDAAGRVTRTTQGPGVWILVSALCAISFGQGFLFQRYVVSNPDSTLLNVPYKKLFHQLPRERRIPVVLRGNRLMGMVNIGMVLTHLTILLLLFHTAHNPDSAAASLSRWLFWVVIGAVVLAPFLEIASMRRMIRRKLIEEGLLPEREPSGIS